MKKFGIVLDETGKVHLCRKICTVYELELEIGRCGTYGTIHLYNLCYVKSIDSFVFNKAIDLPQRLINRYDGATGGIDSKIKEMESIGILDINLIRKKLNLFEECKDFMVYSEYRNKISDRAGKPLKYIEVIHALTQLRQDLIMTSKDDTSIFKIEMHDI